MEPAKVAVPFPFGVTVIPAGMAPVMLTVAVGNADEVTVNDEARFRVKAVAFTLVIVGARFTVSTKGCVAGAPTPLVAVSVNG